MLPNIPEAAVWLIFLLPLFSFLVIAFVIRPFFNDTPKLSGYLTILCIGASLLLSGWALDTVLQATHYNVTWNDPIIYTFIPGIDFGIMLDGLSAIMLLVVCSVSLLVQIYSQGYMKDDTGYCRYYACMSLFTMSMLGLLVAKNLAQVFVFWELVGLCSYLLIGFWFHKPSAAAAAKKAFIVTRIGDFGFLAAILYLFIRADTLDIAELHVAAITGTLAAGVLTWAALGIFAGAVGKSAQFPLHVWLPDAMEGPTPVSALIHAATMVAAGVFLVARMYPLFQPEPGVMTTQLTVVASIGAFTAIFAASMGLVMFDIKRVLAYCTVSQLGYMMLGLGTGGVAIGMFHLFNHAFCKALLFMGSGSVNHATGTFDMRLMGGLRKKMPWTFITFLIGSISMAGVWPLACFWSKDEVLLSAWDSGNWNDGRLILFYLAMITVFMTAFYMFRAVFMTFTGDYKGGAPSEHGHDDNGEHHGVHESPFVMVLPLVILTVLAIGSAWINFFSGEDGGFFAKFLASPAYAELGVHGAHHEEVHGFFDVFLHPGLPLVGLVLGLSGITLAYLMYGAKVISPDTVGKVFKPFRKIFFAKYWFDEIYERVFVVRILMDGVFHACHWFDVHVVDKIVNTVADVTVEAGNLLRKAQTGQLQGYGVGILVGVLVITTLFYIFG